MSSETNQQAAGRALWAAGDPDAIAELSWEVGAVVAGTVPIDAGMKVLDVGTGTGSVAIRAAAAGADVVALDIAPEQFDAARRRADEAGVEVEWVEGDAEALAFDDDSFDRVLSAFGASSACDPDAAALELVRVCRPGGEIVMANWCPESLPGRLSTMLRARLAPEAATATAASEWGTHGHVRRRLGGQLVLAMEPLSVDLVFESVDAMLAHYEASFGPLIAAKADLDAQLYENLRKELRAWMEELDAGDGETRVPASYLLVVGHKPVADLRPNY
ncbi:MAG TPA: methyltransferase domain-containing protein [Solirubrobacteraceae bacterium]|nr:methyltransferase domain-containing protein [Solirubrobacteraceae bacterium]